MQDRFDNYIKRYTASNQRLAVAVSGGKDSMCLLSLVLSSKFIDKNNVLVVSIEHGIRGENSKKDFEFVKAFCKQKCVAFKGFSADIPSMCAVSGRSIEQEAREYRLDTFIKLRKDGLADMVLTAHHASDNAETVLMNMLRGSGVRGICGMEILRDNFLLRPLLFADSDDIIDYVKSNNIPYVTDETNLSNEHSRNFIRNKILPDIMTRWQGAERAILSLSQDVRRMVEYVDRHIDESNFIVKEDCVFLKVSALTDELASEYVYKAFKLLGVFANIERKHIKLVMDLYSAQNGSALDLPHNICAIKEYDNICFCQRSKKPERCLLEFPFCEGEFNFDGRIIQIKKEARAANFDSGKLYFDMDKIPKGAVFRYRMDGDIFKPYKGKNKKLKKWLIDKKIPAREKKDLVLLCVNANALIVLNKEICDDIKADKNVYSIVLT